MAKFYLCNVCENLIEMVNDQGNNPYCCGRPMKELIPGSTDGAIEKHVPVIEIIPLHDSTTGDTTKKVTVSVGSSPHPAELHHYIQWIVLETDQGLYRMDLTSDSKPCAVFYIGKNETVIASYAYCNLHGLWKG